VEEVPAEDVHLVRETPGHPKSVKIYGILKFPNDLITFHALPSMGGKPWFDYGWIRGDMDLPGAEIDPYYPDQYRVLVKFWGFPEVSEKSYAIVTYHQRILPRQGHARWTCHHPLLRTYKPAVVVHNRAQVLPLYAITPDCIVGSAVVFPDPDSRNQVLYMPNDLEICSGSDQKLPDIDKYLPDVVDDEPSSSEEESNSAEEDSSEMEEGEGSGEGSVEGSGENSEEGSEEGSEEDSEEEGDGDDDDDDDDDGGDED